MDYLVGDRQIRGIFGDCPPDLSGLVLQRVVLSSGGGVRLYFHFPHLPSNAPPWWRERQYRHVQLGFLIYGAGDVVVANPGKWTDCSIDIDSSRLVVRGNDDTILYGSTYRELTARFIPWPEAQATAEASEDPYIEGELWAR